MISPSEFKHAFGGETHGLLGAIHCDDRQQDMAPVTVEVLTEAS